MNQGRTASVDVVRARGKDAERLHRRALWRKRLWHLVLHAILLTGAFVMMLPLFWMISTSLKDPGLAYHFPPIWIPPVWHFDTYSGVFTQIPYAEFYRNSIIVTGLVVVGVVVSSSLVAYGFARLRFPGRDVLFMFVLATMMIPYPVTIIPLFELFKNLGWIDTFAPLTVPAFFGDAFSIFLLRQFYMTITTELDDAAKIDGCGFLSIFWRILLPLAKPALATVAIFSFLGTWNDFFGPLIYLSSQDNYTLALGINFLRGLHGSTAGNINYLMAASLMFIAPCIILFFLAQRTFIQGIVTTGLKE